MEVTRRYGRISLVVDCRRLDRLRTASDLDQLPSTRETLRGHRPSAEPVVFRTRSERHRIPRQSWFLPGLTAASARPWLAAISASTSIRPSSSTWPSPSSRSRSGSPTRAFRQRTCRSRTATRPGPSIGSPSSQGGSDWASMVSTGRRRLTMSFSSGRAERKRQIFDQPVVKLDPRQSPAWRTSACPARRQCGPRCIEAVSGDCRLSWWTRSCSSPRTPSGIRRCWPRAASGRRTSSRARIPDQVAIAFGADPARELVWTWRTSAGRRIDCHSSRPTAKTVHRRQAADRCRDRSRTISGS